MMVLIEMMRLFLVIIGCGGNDMICFCMLMRGCSWLMNGISRFKLGVRVLW